MSSQEPYSSPEEYMKKSVWTPKSKVIWGIIILLAIVLIILSIVYNAENLSSKMNLPGCSMSSKAPGYQYCPGKDSLGGDIGNQKFMVGNISNLTKYCNSLANCMGFNTNAWVKKNIKPQSEWVTWSKDPNKGLYIKVPAKEHFATPNYNPDLAGRPMINPFDP